MILREIDNKSLEIFINPNNNLVIVFLHQKEPLAIITNLIVIEYQIYEFVIIKSIDKITIIINGIID